MSTKVRKYMQDLYDLEREIARREEVLNQMRARRHLLATVELPEAMTELGSSYLELDDGSGLSCSVTYKIVGSLPKRDDPDRRFAAIEYLRENDGEGIIKANLLVEFGRGDISAANRLKRSLEFKQVTDQPISVDADVHPSSLAAWGRERVRENKPVKLETVGLLGMTMASVKKAVT
jgi:hypothetical protein